MYARAGRAKFLREPPVETKRKLLIKRGTGLPIARERDDERFDTTVKIDADDMQNASHGAAKSDYSIRRPVAAILHAAPRLKDRDSRSTTLFEMFSPRGFQANCPVHALPARRARPCTRRATAPRYHRSASRVRRHDKPARSPSARCRKSLPAHWPESSRTAPFAPSRARAGRNDVLRSSA